MKLLDEIVQLAADGQTRMGDLLRKCLVLAFDLKNDELKRWLQAELNGYAHKDDVPPYRVINTLSKGLFVGAFRAVDDQPLSLHPLKPEHRAIVEKAHLAQPIGSYELPPDKGNLAIPWPPFLTALYQDKFFEDMSLNRAHQELPRSVVTSLIETVRNKVLVFALEIRESIGPSSSDVTSIPKETVSGFVMNIIYGGQNVIGSHAGNVSQVGSISAGNFDELKGFLVSLGVSDAKIADLREAVEADRVANGGTNTIGKHLSAWIGSVGEVGVKAAGSAGGSAAMAALLRYLGLG